MAPVASDETSQCHIIHPVVVNNLNVTRGADGQPTLLCLEDEDEPLTDADGGLVPNFVANSPYAAIPRFRSRPRIWFFTPTRRFISRLR